MIFVKANCHSLNFFYQINLLHRSRSPRLRSDGQFNNYALLDKSYNDGAITSNTYGDILSFFNVRPTAIVKTRKRPLVISVNIHGAPDLK